MLPWIIGFVILVVLPVVLRLLVGDDPPANELVHEQDGAEESRPEEPDLLAV